MPPGRRGRNKRFSQLQRRRRGKNLGGKKDRFLFSFKKKGKGSKGLGRAHAQQGRKSRRKELTPGSPPITTGRKKGSAAVLQHEE